MFMILMLATGVLSTTPLIGHTEIPQQCPLSPDLFTLANPNSNAFLSVEPGHIVGPYKLSRLIDILGRKSIHPPICHAFRPPELRAPDTATESSLALSLINIDEISREDYYQLDKLFSGGSHGEVWRAQRIDPYDGTLESGYVLKRMLLEKGESIHAAGLREVHFGETLKAKNSRHCFVRYVEHFYRFTSTTQLHNELWLVFHDEGISLQKYLYTEIVTNNYVIHGQSDFWREMRFNANRKGDIMKRFLHQLILAVSVLHEMGIVHRDLKPSNLLVSRDLDSPEILNLKIGDFSSAISKESLEMGLYGLDGPTKHDLTLDYAPPEVLLYPDIAVTNIRPEAYDMWSIGIIFLEMVLGTPRVFTVDQRTRSMLDRKLSGIDNEEVLWRAYLLSAMADYCIYRPAFSQSQQKHWPLGDSPVLGEKCGLDELAKAVLARDSLDLGLPPLALDLLHRLLQWDPLDRISSSEALLHSYFNDNDEKFSSFISDAHRCESFIPQSAWLPQSREMSVLAVDDLAHRFEVKDPLQGVVYVCPMCGRSFDIWNSCQLHVHTRDHGEYCIYDVEKLPSCISTHSMLLFDAHSGWCDVQGRRAKIEDYHALVFNTEYKLFGVFDGHLGSNAAKFVSNALPYHIDIFLKEIPENVNDALMRSFSKTQSEFIRFQNSQKDSGKNSNFGSGTTATAVLVFSDSLTVANIGDSQAVLCCDKLGNEVIMTQNHTPKLEAERKRIINLGGEVELDPSGELRVEGGLAITRRIGHGKINGKTLLSSEPDVHTYKFEDSEYKFEFVIVASDGLWDVMSPKRAVSVVKDVIRGSYLNKEDHLKYLNSYGAYTLDKAYQISATVLTHLAFIEGSTDNIGVCVINLKALSH